MENSEFEISVNLKGFPLRFKTTHDLFSYGEIDGGTKLLIDNLKMSDGFTCLDLGCGYGAIGITMAKLNPKSTVYLVDKDLVAIEYARKNCELNGLSNCRVILSNGFSHIKDVKFDVVVSNLPTHVSKETRTQFFRDAQKQLNQDGKIYVVTVNKVRPYIQKVFQEVFGNYSKVAYSKTHTVSSTQKNV